MARVSTILTNFRSGELSPRLEGRVDLPKYNEGVQTLQNMLSFPSGGITRRPGTYFAGRSKDGGKVRLISFEFSDEQAYILEFGANYIRFFKDGGILTEATTAITGITQANPAVVTAASHGLSNGDRVFITSVAGMSQVNNLEFTVANATTNTFELSGIDSTNYDAYTSGGAVGKIVEVTTTYSVTDIFEINHAQSADVIYLAHKGHEPAKLTRTTSTSFTLTDVDFIDGPYLDENITSTTLYASAATGSVTITASSALFTANDVGRYIRFRELIEIQHEEWEANKSYVNNATVRYNEHVYKNVTGSTQTSNNSPPVHTTGTETYGAIDWQYVHDDTGYVKITSFTSSTSVDATVQTDDGGISVLPDSIVGSGGATIRWSLGAFGGDQGYPRALAFYEERLFFAGTTGQPQTIFGSVSADFENHTPGTEDDAAINVTIASDKVNVIKHLMQGRFLQIMTTSAEFTMSGGGNAVLSPTNVNVLRETTFGTSDITPLRAASSTIFIQKGQEKVKEITFSEAQDGLTGVELSILADHITRGGVTDMVWQQEPELVIWFVHSDGRLIGLTYDRANGAVGWHTHPLGGNEPIVESIASIPSGAEDQVYISVKRRIDGADYRHIEYLKPINFGDDVEDAFFVDSGLTYSGSATTTISGINHLEGEEVAILADGATHANKTVTDGKITLDRSASVVHLGYNYTSLVETLRLEAGGNDGTSQGNIKRIHSVTSRFLNTVGAEVGPDTSNLDRIPFRNSSMAMNTAVPLFTGDKEISFPSGYDNDARVVIRQNQPLPMTVLAIIRRSNTFDV